MQRSERVWLGTLLLGMSVAGLAALGLAAAPRTAAAAAGAGTPAEFFEQRVRPILQARCYSCHGDKAQLSGLRLDSREAALKGGKRGAAVVPGDPVRSSLVQAVDYHGALKMPPAGKLSAAEVAALTLWVKEGAAWGSANAAAPGGGLWSFQPVRNRALPPVQSKRWPRTPIDRFVLAELEKQQLKPSPYADRRTLIRRVSLDLVGLPPTPEEVDAFVADPSPTAYEKVVDRLLADPHYGERMAQHWLDLARYADSDGYHDDTDRTMWAYRDYVINAFNQNKRYDQFTIEQLAGDLLPNATLEQRIASAFNRCGPTSSEGGAIPEEYLSKYAVDRVNTTGAIWLGMTVQCCECHNHKYDPLTAKDFYQLFAFFNQVPETALYRGADAPPSIPTPTPQQQARLDELAGQIAGLQQEMKAASSTGRTVDDLKKKLDEVTKSRAELDKAVPKLRIMVDMQPRRPTYLLVRGDYRNHGEEVLPGVPAALGKLPDGKADRLALAKWLVSPEQPLTARVTVNRLWQLVYGTGLVKSSEDFGTRGELPSHPELLDWLANEFVKSGWDVKHMLRLIVTSATYQQTSRATPALLTKDPDNRLLARGPRFRLPAELIRDNALAVSGLLDRSRPVGGPSTKPYQPGDLWRELSAGDQAAKSYVQDHGPDLYRRGLYTFWKRSVLYPSFAVFDAPKRETCTVRRPITNTPLQAFVTLNDVTYVEAARVLAQRALQQGGATPDQRVAYLVRQVLGRLPNPRESAALSGIYRKTLTQFQTDLPAATKLASAGEFPRPAELDAAEHAAWTCVCNAILNMDETLTKE